MILQPHVATGEATATLLGASGHSPGMDIPRQWPDRVFLVHHISPLSPHIGGHTIKDFFTLPMGLAPGQRDTIATCVPFTSPQGPDHCASGVMRRLLCGRVWHASLVSPSPLVFSCSPHQRRMLLSTSCMCLQTPQI